MHKTHYSQHNLTSITDIETTAMQTFKGRLGWKLWLIVGFSVAWGLAVVIVINRYRLDENLLALILLPLMWLLFYYVKIRESIRSEFWLLFAFNRKWSYEGHGDPTKEAGIMFHEGHSQRISHAIAGTLYNRPLRIYELSFTKGRGKRSVTSGYTVFEFKFKGHFPHLYLNQLKNRYGVRVGETISLPGEFEKYFRLSVPKKYEIEALQIFTPEILSHLLDIKLECDIEIVEQELLIFMEGHVKRLEQLENEFKKATALAQFFAPVFDTFKFTQVGDLPHILTHYSH